MPAEQISVHVTWIEGFVFHMSWLISVITQKEAEGTTLVHFVVGGQEGDLLIWEQTMMRSHSVNIWTVIKQTSSQRLQHCFFNQVLL